MPADHRIVRITTPPTLPPRSDDGHKGTFGRCLIVAGSRGMSGAAALSGLGALRGGYAKLRPYLDEVQRRAFAAPLTFDRLIR